MKYRFVIERDFEVKQLRASMRVRYWGNSIVNGVECESSSDMPLASGDAWRINIDVDDGRIIDWPHGKTADVHFKVRDGGEYSLVDENGMTIISHQCYVPKMLCPNENGCGDYVIMKIDENGFIENWRCDFDDFVERAQ